MQMFEEKKKDFFQSDWSKTGENMQIKCKFHGNQSPNIKRGLNQEKLY